MQNYLLTNQNTRVFNVQLAQAIGLNEAIVLQQIQYWIEIKETDKSKYKDSFHDGYVWVYNSIPKWQEQLPFWSYDTVKRTLKSLEKKGVIISGVYNKAKYDKTKWYRIDYDILDKIVSETLENIDECKMPLSNSAKSHDGIEQDAPTNTKDYTDITTDTTIKCIKWSFTPKEIKPNTSFSYEILKKQIALCYNKLGLSNEYQNEAIDTIVYYFSKYYTTFGERHPNLSNNAMCGVLQKYAEGSEMVECYTDAETYEILIDKHFETEYKNCDYNICHFMTDGILDNRFYETCY